jgi:hypothetical protein
MKKKRAKEDEIQAAVRVGREIIKRHEQPLPDDVEAAWAEWSRNLPGADSRGVALLRAAFDTGVKVGRLESKKNRQ